MSNQYVLSRETVVTIADILKVDKDALLSTFKLLEKSPLSLYATVRLRKGTGSFREILVPTESLKLLQNVVLRTCLKNFKHGKYYHGFTRFRSVITNANCHVGSTLAVSLDFANFFTSVKGDKVFQQFLGLCHGPELAYLFTLACTVASPDVDSTDLSNRYLPQGTSTSPILSNLCTNKFDYRVANLLTKKLSSWTFSRYADDLTFSTKDSTQDIGRLLNAVTRIATDEGYSIATSKTHVERSPLSICVTGIMVNPQLHLPRSYTRKIRSAIHKLNVESTVHESTMRRQALRLSGMLSFLASVSFNQFNDLYVEHNLHENLWMMETPISKYFWSTRLHKRAIPRKTKNSVRRNIYKLETTKSYMEAYRLSELRNNMLTIRDINPVDFQTFLGKHGWLSQLIASETIPNSDQLGLPIQSTKLGNKMLRKTLFRRRFRRHSSSNNDNDTSSEFEDNNVNIRGWTCMTNAYEAYPLPGNDQLDVCAERVESQETVGAESTLENADIYGKVKKEPIRVSFENWFDGKIHNL